MRIKGERNQLIIGDDDLREINLGECEEKTYDHLKEKYPEEYNAFWNTPQLYTTNLGEDFFQLQERVSNFLNRITSENNEGNLLIASEDRRNIYK